MTDWTEWCDSVPMPLVSHETGQWCVFPDLEEIGKYTGVLEARNFIMVRDDLAEKGLLPLARDYLLASGALQTQLYKEEMEAALRTRDFPGTQLLGLQDFSGQGTALVGLVDAFWDEKPYVTPGQFREFCAPVVPLVRSGSFVCETGEAFTAAVQVAQFGPHDLERPRIAWALNDAGRAVATGMLEPGDLATGHLHDVGIIEIPTADLAAPRRYELVVSLEGTDYRNRWGIWVMPAGAAEKPLAIVDAIDEAILDRVAGGETVVFSPRPEAMQSNAALGHTAAFWNTLCTNGQEPHTLGLLNETGHPVFAGFPAARHSDWHLWELTFGRRALDIAGVPFASIIRVIDDWNENRDLVMLAEARIGNGRLIVSAIDLEGDLATRSVARSFRNALADYAASGGSGGPDLDKAAIVKWWERIEA